MFWPKARWPPFDWIARMGIDPGNGFANRKYNEKYKLIIIKQLFILKS
jgi:hypothetical protein